MNENNQSNDQQVGLSVPSDSKMKKGKSFCNTSNKLNTKDKTEEAKDKLKSNHKSMTKFEQRRLTFGYSLRNKLRFWNNQSSFSKNK